MDYVYLCMTFYKAFKYSSFIQHIPKEEKKLEVLPEMQNATLSKTKQH